MGRPQQPELQRSGNTPIDPDHLGTETEIHPHAPSDEPGGGPVPPDNQPGHRPDHDQDKPDLDAFAERLGTVNTGEDDDASADAPHATDADREVADATDADDEHGPIQVLRTAAGAARGLAGPVVHVVHDGVTRAVRVLDDRRRLVGRVDRLEQRVAELSAQLEERRRAS